MPGDQGVVVEKDVVEVENHVEAAKVFEKALPTAQEVVDRILEDAAPKHCVGEDLEREGAAFLTKNQQVAPQVKGATYVATSDNVKSAQVAMNESSDTKVNMPPAFALLQELLDEAFPSGDSRVALAGLLLERIAGSII